MSNIFDEFIIPFFQEAFKKTYEFDGFDSTRAKYTTAYGEKGKYFASDPNVIHAILTFLGFPTRAESIEKNIETGDYLRMSFLQLLRNFIGGWNDLRDESGKWKISEKGWWNIAVLIPIKFALILPLKIIAIPFNLLVNIIKLFIEFMPLLLIYFMEISSRYPLEALPGTYHRVDINSFAKGSLLVVYGFSFAMSYLIYLSAKLVYTLGVALTSPEKSAREWFLYGMNTVPKEGHRFLVGFIFSTVSLILSTCLWAVSIVLLINIIPILFPTLNLFFAKLLTIPAVQTSFVFVKSTLFGLNSFMLNYVASPLVILLSKVGLQFSALSLSVGITLAVTLAPISIILSNLTNRFSNMWASFTDDGPIMWIRASKVSRTDSEILKKHFKTHHAPQTDDDFSIRKAVKDLVQRSKNFCHEAKENMENLNSHLDEDLYDEGRRPIAKSANEVTHPTHSTSLFDRP